MKKSTKIISVVLLAGALSMTAVGCGTTGDQGNISSSQSSTQDILSQDPKEVYQKVCDKMQSINSMSRQIEYTFAIPDLQGNISSMSASGYMEMEDRNSTNPKIKSTFNVVTPNASSEGTTYILDGYKYSIESEGPNGQAVKRKLPITKEDKEAFNVWFIDGLINPKLEEDAEGRVVILSDLTQSTIDSFKSFTGIIEEVEGYERATIDNDYRIISIEVSARGKNNEKITMNIKCTYSYEPIKVEFPSFEGYEEPKL